MKETIEALASYCPMMHGAIISGYHKAMYFVKSSPKLLDKTTISNIVNCFIRDEIKLLFPTQFMKNKEKLAVLKINKYLIRFKKLDKNLCAGNVATKQSDSFFEQRELPGFNPSINLHVGWTLDATGTIIDGVYLTRPIAKRENLWVLNLTQFITHGNRIPLPPIVQAASAAVEDHNVIEELAINDTAKRRRKQQIAQNE